MGVMCALTVRMLVRQPMMLFSFVFVKWIPDFTLILPKGGKKRRSHLAETHGRSNRPLSYTTKNREGKIFLYNDQVVFKMRSN